MIENLKIDEDLLEMFDSVLADYRDRAGENMPVFDAELWAQFAELGLTRLTGNEELGGSGAGWAEAAALISALASHGVRSPYAEHDLLAGWLAESLDLEAGELMTVAEIKEGKAVRVPWASVADRILVVWKDDSGYKAASVAASETSIAGGSNNIDEPRDTVEVDTSKLEGKALSNEVYAELGLKQALVRAIAASAALNKTLELSIEHAVTRNQFGRAIAKFQAVQHMVADIAGESALAKTATDGALLEAINSDWQADNLPFLVAVARSNVGHSASTVVRNAHQVHGAIGTTKEHELHRFTRAALVWRGEYGSVAVWDERILDAAVEVGEEGLWDLVTG